MRFVQKSAPEPIVCRVQAVLVQGEMGLKLYHKASREVFIIVSVNGCD